MSQGARPADVTRAVLAGSVVCLQQRKYKESTPIQSSEVTLNIYGHCFGEASRQWVTSLSVEE